MTPTDRHHNDPELLALDRALDQAARGHTRDDDPALGALASFSGWVSDRATAIETAARPAPSAKPWRQRAASRRAASGRAPSGEAPFGLAASGVAPSGEVPLGLAASGDAPSGEAPFGRASSGRHASPWLGSRRDRSGRVAPRRGGAGWTRRVLAGAGVAAVAVLLVGLLPFNASATSPLHPLHALFFQSTDPAAERSLTLLANARDTLDDASHRTGPQRDAALVEARGQLDQARAEVDRIVDSATKSAMAQQLAELEQRLRALTDDSERSQGGDDQSGPGAGGDQGDSGPTDEDQPDQGDPSNS